MNNNLTLEVLLDRLVKQRLPHAENLLAKAEAGQSLNTFDMAFLTSAMEDLQKTQHLYSESIELRNLYAKIAALYVKIVESTSTNLLRK